MVGGSNPKSPRFLLISSSSFSSYFSSNQKIFFCFNVEFELDLSAVDKCFFKYGLVIMLERRKRNNFSIKGFKPRMDVPDVERANNDSKEPGSVETTLADSVNNGDFVE